MAVQVTRLSSSVRSIIVNLHKEKLSSVQIQRELERRHQTKTTRQSIRLFLIRYKKNGLIGQNSKRIISKKRVLDIHRQAINLWLTENSEFTSKGLCEKLKDIFQLQVTTSYMCKLRKQLGWTTIRIQLYQDNDSKHKSKSTKQWMSNKNMLDNVMKTPASSPDLNPIENLWSTLKQYPQSKVKLKTKETLISGIRQFWEALTVEQCIKYIDHIHKVIPVVILNDGASSGY
ncbi:unnamed protein product [Mytilus coruscus]|uniref:Tc1-like transposase DDE domain-containing protein n=1 Tax=Mytilus coruscus TaxID=42192 RepID=A0A6J8BQT7_MYTCO|nr:unnamed protein product [Mytilus coruscus]